ncbi:MAG: hypothetical protein Q8K29_01555 [Polaromonas sp.]|nr:hypothetical protein [Polaromonas sp.]
MANPPFRPTATKDLRSVEEEIDEAFATNDLVLLPFAQCAWTLLSVVEDHHFKITVSSPLEAAQATIYVDGLMNSLTYPMRVCYQRASRGPAPFEKKLVDTHYQLADQWLDKAEDYAQFCTIFPLFHAKEIDLHLEGNRLIPTDWSTTDLSYEVYDRFIAKRNPNDETSLDANPVRQELIANMRKSGGFFSVDFTRSLLNSLSKALGKSIRSRHVLPEEWQFKHFSLGEYRAVFSCLQAMAFGWFCARQIVAMDGASAVAFPSAVWTPRKGQLLTIISRHTGIQKKVVEAILLYLTFGEVGIRNPDIAIQPLVDLTNGQYAISPFVMTHVNAERNLCVLLNQIPADRKLYSTLVDEKENQARTETIDALGALGLDFKHGQLGKTDVDLAIIDRKAKVCLCVEIKWFIEPAEVREILDRSEELRKGVRQANLISKMFSESDSTLLALLEIDKSYDFLAMVGSVNFIGGHRVQHPDVPITKLWHLAADIQHKGSLAASVSWLRNRSYLPKKDIDFKIEEVEIRSGNWISTWYGIGHAQADLALSE